MPMVLSGPIRWYSSCGVISHHAFARANRLSRLGLGLRDIAGINGPIRGGVSNQDIHACRHSRESITRSVLNVAQLDDEMLCIGDSRQVHNDLVGVRTDARVGASGWRGRDCGRALSNRCVAVGSDRSIKCEDKAVIVVRSTAATFDSGRSIDLQWNVEVAGAAVCFS